MKLTEFEKEILKSLKRVPLGRVTTYAELARAVGRPGAARAAGNALNKNPFAPRVPCHRAVKSDGRIGGYARGISRKIELLNQEGVLVKDGRVADFSRILYEFSN